MKGKMKRLLSIAIVLSMILGLVTTNYFGGSIVKAESAGKYKIIHNGRFIITPEGEVQDIVKRITNLKVEDNVDILKGQIVKDAISPLHILKQDGYYRLVGSEYVKLSAVPHGNLTKIVGENDGVSILSDTGEVYSIGSNTFGKLGNGSGTGGGYISEELVKVSIEGVVDIFSLGGLASNFGSRYAIVGEEKELYVWGANSYSQLGLGDTKNRDLPVTTGLKNIKKVVGIGNQLAMVLDRDGNVYYMGKTPDGVTLSTPTAIMQFVGIQDIFQGGFLLKTDNSLERVFPSTNFNVLQKDDTIDYFDGNYLITSKGELLYYYENSGGRGFYRLDSDISGIAKDGITRFVEYDEPYGTTSIHPRAFEASAGNILISTTTTKSNKADINITKIDANYEVKWRVKIPYFPSENVNSSEVGFIGAEYFHENKNGDYVFVGGAGDYVVCLDKDTGAQKWRTENFSRGGKIYQKPRFVEVKYMKFYSSYGISQEGLIVGSIVDASLGTVHQNLSFIDVETGEVIREYRYPDAWTLKYEGIAYDEEGVPYLIAPDTIKKMTLGGLADTDLKIENLSRDLPVLYAKNTVSKNDINDNTLWSFKNNPSLFEC